MLLNTPHPVHVIARNFIKQNASFNELWNFASNTKKYILNWSVMLLLLEIGSTDLLFYSDPKTMIVFLGDQSVTSRYLQFLPCDIKSKYISVNFVGHNVDYQYKFISNE